MASVTWCPMHYSDSDHTSIVERVRDIAHRMRDTTYTLEMSRIAAEQSKYIQGSGYRIYSLARGPLGLALLYAELERTFPEEGWDQTAHEYLTLLPKEIVVDDRQDFGLLSGVCGLLFVAHFLSRDGSRYQRLLGELNRTVLPGLVGHVYDILKEDKPTQRQYDLANGAVGISATFLTLAKQSDIPGGMSMLLNHLVWLSKRDIEQDVDCYDHWYRSSELRDSLARWNVADSSFVGYGICGGLAGLVALLSLTLTHGRSVQDVSGIADTLKMLCEQLRRGMRRDELGWHWPTQHNDEFGHCAQAYVRFAWSDGICGIARALWMAGQALHDESLCTLALECVYEVSQHFRRRPTVMELSLCHGMAGMLQVYTHFASETRDSTMIEAAHLLSGYLLDSFEPDRPFGYRVVEPEFIRVDVPWLFKGASGVALALLATVSPDPPAWDRVMLIA